MPSHVTCHAKDLAVHSTRKANSNMHNSVIFDGKDESLGGLLVRWICEKVVLRAKWVESNGGSYGLFKLMDTLSSACYTNHLSIYADCLHRRTQNLRQFLSM